jgi:hypothetical protein
MPSPSKAFMRWAASILAAAINSGVIYPPANPQPTVPFHASTQVQGGVLDLPVKKLISDARLMLRAANYAGTVLTDVSGTTDSILHGRKLCKRVL